MVKVLEWENNFKKFEAVRSSLLFSSIETSARPLVTVCIPTFKRNELLKQSLESLRQQTIQDFAVLIVDNNDDESDTSTLDLIRTYTDLKVSYYKNLKNIGMFGNWNRSGELAQTPWMSILNDDDLFKPTLIEEFLKVLKDKSQADVIAFGYDTLDERAQSGKNRFGFAKKILKSVVGLFRPEVRELTLFDYFVSNHHAGSLGVFLKTSAFMESGGFNSELFPTADYFYWSSLASKKKVYFSKKKLTVYRILLNESLKLTTLEGWSEQILAFRMEVLSHLNFVLAGSAYAKVSTIAMIRHYGMLFGSADRAVENRIAQKLGIAGLYQSKAMQLFYLFYKTVYLVIKG